MSSKSAIPLPPPRRVIQLETEGCKRKLEEAKAMGNSKLTALFTQEVIKRKDLFRLLTGESYEPPMDVSQLEKDSMAKTFFSLGGFGWRKTFGWSGLLETVTRPDIKPLEAEASIYDGVKLLKLFAGTGSVGILDLEGFGCEGFIPREIGEFRSIKKLLLGLNVLRGEIPNRISEFVKIETLDFTGNELHGDYDDNFFEGIGEKLLNFNLSFNSMSGPLPDCFYNFKALEHLNLSGNNLIGNLPPSISSLSKLRSLKLYSNLLEGELPKIFSTCVAIEDINLSQNKFFGPPLDVFSNCTNLKRLNLSNNLFDKELNISSISGLNSLELLYLQNNSIKGEIDNQISCLVSLRFFNVSNNQIKGKLPPNFGELRKLETCILSNNQIIGPIPKSLSEICNLKDFHIFNQWPSESMALPRAFKSLSYRRLYKDALLLRFDSLSWDEHENLKTVSSSHNVNNGKNNVDIKDKKKKKKKKKNQKNVQK